MTDQCWCGAVHDPESDSVIELSASLSHQLIAAARIPQIVEWLARVLTALDGWLRRRRT